MRRSIVGGVLLTGALVVLAASGLVGATAIWASSAAIPQGNLVRNPGGEANAGGVNSIANIAPTGWTQSVESTRAKGAIQVVRYGAHGYFPSKAFAKSIGGGANFFIGGYPSPLSRSFQLIDVSGAGAEIDAGGLKACLSAYLGGVRTFPNTARVDVGFLGADGAQLGQLRVGPVTSGHRKGETTLLRRAGESRVPANTRQLRVEILSEGSLAYAENISVALTRGACEPVLAVRCARGALLATVTPSAIARTQRVRFLVRGAKGRRLVNDARAPYTARVPMRGLTGRLTVTATVSQPGSGPIVLQKKSRRC